METLTTRMFPMEGQQKEIEYLVGHMTLLGKNCEVEKMMRFLKETDV